MTFGRLTGDAVAVRFGDRLTMLWGGLLTITGYVVLLTASAAIAAFAGLLLIGLGAANTVPVLFRQAGAQTAMPAGLAIASVTTVGYAGILVGPAGVSFLAQIIGLPNVFWVLAGLRVLVPLCAGFAAATTGVYRKSRSPPIQPLTALASTPCGHRRCGNDVPTSYRTDVRHQDPGKLPLRCGTNRSRVLWRKGSPIYSRGGIISMATLFGQIVPDLIEPVPSRVRYQRIAAPWQPHRRANSGR